MIDSYIVLFAIKSFLLINLINQSDHLNPHMQAEVMIDLRPSLNLILCDVSINPLFLYALLEIYHT